MMNGRNRYGRVNVKVLLIVIGAVVVLGAGALLARHVRRVIISRNALADGSAAYEKEQWEEAWQDFRRYLVYHPEDPEILRKYAKAHLAIEPFEPQNAFGAIDGYRRLLNVAPQDKEVFEELARLYAYVGDARELARIAEKRLEAAPGDLSARLWLARARLAQNNKEKEAHGDLRAVLDDLEKAGEAPADSYVQACELLMALAPQYSRLGKDREAEGAVDETLDWLDRAAGHFPDSPKVMLLRAGALTDKWQRLHRQARDETGASRVRLEAEAKTCRQRAEQDLRRASDLAAALADAPDGAQSAEYDPGIHLGLAREWLRLTPPQLDRVEECLRAAQKASREQLRRHYLDLRDWAVAKFQLAGMLALARGDTRRAADLADSVLGAREPASRSATQGEADLAGFTDKGHRVAVLPLAIRLYAAAGDPQAARKCLDEYVETMRVLQRTVEPAQQALLDATVARAEGKPLEVIKVLERERRHTSSDPVLGRMLAEAYAAAGQRAKVFAVMREIQALNPEDPRAGVQLAREHLQRGRWKEALAAAKSAEPEDAQQSDLDTELARLDVLSRCAARLPAKEKDNELTGLAQALDRLRASNPGDVRIRLLQATVAEGRGNLDAAKAVLEQAIAECGKEGELPARLQLARVYMAKGQTDEGIEVCRQACKTHPESTAAWISLATALRANGKNPESRQALKDGLDKCIESTAKRSLGILLALYEIMDGDRKAGILRLQDLATNDVKDVNVRDILLMLPETLADPDKANTLVREMRDAGAEGEQGLLWQYHQARLWFQADWRAKQEQIVELLTACLQADPGWQGPAILLAEMYTRQQRHDDAEAVCRRALAESPAARDVAAYLIARLDRQGRDREAREVLDSLSAGPGTLGLRATLSARAGDVSDAINDLKDRIEAAPDDVGAMALSARLIYRQEKDLARAMSLLDNAQAKATGVGHVAVAEARAEILLAEGRQADCLKVLDAELDRKIAHPEEDGRHKFGAHFLRARCLRSMYNPSVVRFSYDDGTLRKTEYLLAGKAVSQTEFDEKYRQIENEYAALPGMAEDGSREVLLARFHADSGRFDKAVEVLDGAAKRYPANQGLQRMLVRTLYSRDAQGDRDEADGRLARLEKDLPDDPDLMAIRSLRLLQEGTEEAARRAAQLLERVVELRPNTVDAHLTLIRLSPDAKTAQQRAVRALKANPNSSELILARAEAEAALRNWDVAAVSARSVLEKVPGNMGALGILGGIAVRTRDEGIVREVRTRTVEALQADPGDLRALEILGGIGVSTRDRDLLEQARQLAAVAEKRSPDSTRVRLVHAAVLEALGQPDAAIAVLKSYSGTETGRRSLAAVLALAGLYRAQKQFAEAGECISQASKIDAGSPAVVHERLLWLGAQGKMDETSKFMADYSSKVNADPTVLSAGASVLASSGSEAHWAQARALYEQSLSKAPGQIGARVGLAWLAYMARQGDRAEKLYREVLDLDHDNVQALNDLAWILQEKNKKAAESAGRPEDYDESLQLANRGIALEPENRHLRDTRGVILSNIGRHQEARADFQKCVDLCAADSPERAKALFQLGRAHVRLEEFSKAEQCLAQALKIDSGKRVFGEQERQEISALLDRCRAGAKKTPAAISGS